MPGLQASSPLGGVQEATTHWCFSPSLCPSLPLSLKISKIFNKENNTSFEVDPTWPCIPGAITCQVSDTDAYGRAKDQVIAVPSTVLTWNRGDLSLTSARLKVPWKQGLFPLKFTSLHNTGHTAVMTSACEWMWMTQKPDTRCQPDWMYVSGNHVCNCCFT